MDISINLPTFMTPRTRRDELAWYRKVDEGPWRSLVVWERMVYPGWALLVQLAAAAAVTERIRLCTDIATLPPRNPVLFAKEVASIDALSNGRVTLGVGIGVHDEDYLALGSELTRKRERLDSHVDTMRRVWAQVPPVEGHLPIGPVPVQPGGIPIIAGVSGPKALARAAKWADGVSDGTQGQNLNGEYLAAQRERVVQAWRVAGRTDKPHFSAGVWFALGPNPKEQLFDALWSYMSEWDGKDVREQYNASPSFGEKGLLDAVAAAKAAGLDELRIIPTTDDPAEIDRARDVLGI